MAESDEEVVKKKTNSLPLWGNQQTMNINNLIVTNILSSPYFKNELFKIKTFHEVIDEIYYKVEHLEPWEKGSRKIRGQVGMCGGVRGVGTGGIVSSTFCLLFKLFTLKLTKKQVYVLLNHADSPYIRALGFMFIRFCQHPNTYWEWFEPYLEDNEEVDPKAGGGCTMTMGQMVRSFLLKPDWYGTLFPRIPVPIHKEIEASLKAINLDDDRKIYATDDDRQETIEEQTSKDDSFSFGEAEKYAKQKRDEKKYSDQDDDRHGRIGSYDNNNSKKTKRGGRSRSRDRSRSRERSHKSPRRSRERDHKDSHYKVRKRSRSKERKRSRSREHKKRYPKDQKQRSRSHDRSKKRSRSEDRSNDYKR